jgi:predicted helicase
VTARDKFVIDFNIHELSLKMIQFRDLSLPDDFIEGTYGLKDTRGWKLSEARKKLSSDVNWDTYYSKILYRPFDHRTIYYTPDMVDWGRHEVMHHMFKDNIGIATVRQVKSGETWQHCLISNKIIESCFVSNKTSEIGYLFPLYLYEDEEKLNLFSSQQSGRENNLSKDVYDHLKDNYSSLLRPELVLRYVYAILYCNTYRVRYFDFLKVDFPRIPFTNSDEIFQSMALLGERLIDLHLLKGPELNSPTIKYQGQDDNHIIEKPTYRQSEKRVYINKTHYFEGVEPEVWEYQIGGYQVMHKYLKDRKGRKMDDPRHYIRVATALAKTIEIQAEIDEIYPEVEKDVIDF